MNNLVNVCGCPHPFRTTRIDEVVEAGGTLEQIISRGLDRMDVPEYLRDCGHAYIGAKYIPREVWATTTPLPGDFVTYRIIPQKGDGKNPLRTLLTLAVIVVASFVSFGVAGMSVFATGGALAGFGGVAGAIAAGAVTAAGMLAVNAMVPIKPPSLPSASSEADSPTYSVAGARNALSPFGTVPVLLGRHRITPPQGARPYTEIVGNDQYVRQLFILGYSDIQPVSSIRIGDTPLSYYKEVQWEFIPETAAAAPYTRPKYYSSDVNEDSLSVQLKEASSWQVRTTPQTCDRFSFDVSFPRGLVEFEDDGDKTSRTVVVDAQYRRQGDSTWIDITGLGGVPAEEFRVPYARTRVFEQDYEDYYYEPTTRPYILCSSQSGDVELREGTVVPSGYIGIFSFKAYGPDIIDVVSIAPPGSSGFSLAKSGLGVSYIKVTMGAGSLPMSNLVVTGKQTTALRRSFTVTPGASDVYEVRLRRVTADSTEDQIVDETWWGSLRAISFVSPVRFQQPLAAISLRIKATGQLNGAIDELNVDAVTVCKDWDYKTSTWVERPTENPASLFRHVLQHPANARRLPDSQLDLVQLQKWHNFCRTKGFSYSRYHDFADGVYAVLQDIAAAGRASVSRPDGLWSVVIDEPKTTVAQHFTPANSWGFNSTKALPRLPHAWRVRFINEEIGYQSDERIVYDDLHNEANATEFEGLELPGVTDPNQVWKLARYHYACSKLRPEEYEFFADMEHIVCTRGDLIRVAHDVPLWGIAQGRVKSVAGQIVTVDNPCQMLPGVRYTVRFRLQTGATLVREVVCVEGVNQSIELMGAGSVPAAGDIFMFGELNLESADLIVKHIEPSANFSARIVALDYSPEVFSADSGIIPAFQTSITRPYKSRLNIPPIPTVVRLRSDEAMLLRNPDGSLSSRIYIQFRLPSGTEVDDIQIQARYREAGAESWTSLPPVQASAEFLYAYPVEDKATYEIELRSVTSHTGLASKWTATVSHTAVGKTSKPPTVSGFTAVATSEGIRLSWKRVSPLDVSRYVVRRGTTWNPAEDPAYDGDGTSVVLPPAGAGLHTFLIKAVDIVGNESLVAATASLTTYAPGPVSVSAQVIDNNVLLRWTESTGGSFPVLEYEVRKGTTWANSELIGRISARFATIFESAAGSYTYHVAAVDTAKTIGTPSPCAATVNQPPDYALQDQQYSTFSGTKTNALALGGELFFPVNLTETWAQHYTNNAWDQPQDQIDAGFPAYIQPTPLTASYQEVIDYGAVISGSKISVTPALTAIYGSVAMSCQIETKKYSGDAWGTPVSGFSAFFTDFQFARITLTWTPSGGQDDLAKLTSLEVKLSVKTINDAGTKTCNAADSGGTTVNFNIPFVDVTSITVSPKAGGSARYALYDFVDAPNPTSFKILLYDLNGNRVSGDASWSAKGV